MSFGEDQLTCDKFLNGRLNIRQPIDGYRAATDPVFLAAAFPASSGETVLDIGCGVGTSGLCLAHRTAACVTGLELQANYAELARRNATANQIEMLVVEGDLTQMPKQLKDQVFDHVIMNPPFFVPGTAPADSGRAIAMHEQTELSQWIDSGLRRLRPRGWLTLIQSIERLPEVIAALDKRAGSLHIKPLSPRKRKSAIRFVIRGQKGSRGRLVLANPLILHDGERHMADGDSFSSEAQAILRDGAALDF